MRVLTARAVLLRAACLAAFLCGSAAPPPARGQEVAASKVLEDAEIGSGRVLATERLSDTDFVLVACANPDECEVARLGPDLKAKWKTLFRVNRPGVPRSLPARYKGEEAPSLARSSDFGPLHGTSTLAVAVVAGQVRVVTVSGNQVMLRAFDAETGAMTERPLAGGETVKQGHGLVRSKEGRWLAVVTFDWSGASPRTSARFFDPDMVETGSGDLPGDTVERFRKRKIDLKRYVADLELDEKGRLHRVSFQGTGWMDVTRHDARGGSSKVAVDLTSIPDLDALRLAVGPDGRVTLALVEGGTNDVVTVGVDLDKETEVYFRKRSLASLFPDLTAEQRKFQVLSSLVPLPNGDVVLSSWDGKVETNRSGYWDQTQRLVVGDIQLVSIRPDGEVGWKATVARDLWSDAVAAGLGVFPIITLVGDTVRVLYASTAGGTRLFLADVSSADGKVSESRLLLRGMGDVAWLAPFTVHLDPEHLILGVSLNGTSLVPWAHAVDLSKSGETQPKRPARSVAADSAISSSSSKSGPSRRERAEVLRRKGVAAVVVASTVGLPLLIGGLALAGSDPADSDVDLGRVVAAVYLVIGGTAVTASLYPVGIANLVKAEKAAPRADAGPGAVARPTLASAPAPDVTAAAAPSVAPRPVVLPALGPGWVGVVGTF